ncbi:hypothetical protein [uncultured Dokdonia sp.]|uniref:hypothetical protein n=1 Tax=uncultured Dokdonia sp. TaxID=575653 RepID=UPI002627335E|nr:hypothetical protein [uncultured Dokdonia sp.]
MKTHLTLYAWMLCLCLFICSCSSDDNNNEPQQMEEDPVEESFTGDYRGTWNSVTPSITYTDFAISAKFVVSAANPNRIDAQFFATSNFTSCCSTNANDGTMIINLDGDTITSFSFIDTIVDCEGSFSGNGMIDANGNFIIDFTGNDCDGDHVGQLLFIKQ